MFGSKKRAVRARIAQAGLPAEVSRFIAEVVRRTRLRRAEQVDVAGELVSHFAEGLAAGRAERDLIAAYGDPKSSARELRRSTIGKRHVVDRAIGGAFKWSAVAFAGACALYMGYATVLSFRQPVISFDGTAVVNAGMPKAGSEGPAIDLYLAALSSADGTCVLLDIVRDEAADQRLQDALPRIAFDERALAVVREELGRLQSSVGALREVRTRGALGVPAMVGSWKDPRLAKFFAVGGVGGDPQGVITGALIWALLPQVTMLHRTSRMMCADAALAVHDGRADDFMADIEAAWTMAGHAGETGFLISALVEFANREQVLRTVVSALENHAEILSDAQLDRLDQLLRTVDVPRTMVRAIESERLMIRDLVQRCYSDDGDGDGVLLAHAFEQLMASTTGVRGVRQSSGERSLGRAGAFLGGPVAATAMPSRREFFAMFDPHIDRLIEAAKSPSRSDSLAIARACDSDNEKRTGTAPTIADLFAPAMGRSVGVSWGFRCSVEGALAAVGIERFRRANGRFPATLAELNGFVGRELGASSDTRAPWKYAVVDGRPLIYDCGIDGLDDRARTPLEERSPEEGATAVPPRVVSLSACTADGAFHVGPPTQDGGGDTRRVKSAVAADAPLAPAQPIADVETQGVLRSDGDFIRVWWKSRASGWSRVTPAAER